MAANPLNPQELLLTLYQWHISDNESSKPISFPGPLASETELLQWLRDVREKCEEQSINRLQHANAAISWLSRVNNMRQGTRGQKEEETKKEQFRVLVIKRMKEKRDEGVLHQGRYWKWIDFEKELLEMCESEVAKRNWRIAGTVATAVGGFMLTPLAGTALLGVAGFSSAGIVGGSAAAWVQSTFYGGATGGLFSILQSVGARAVVPAMGEIIAGVGLVGSGVAIAATSFSEDTSSRPDGQENSDARIRIALIVVGDIGDIL